MFLDRAWYLIALAALLAGLGVIDFHGEERGLGVHRYGSDAQASAGKSATTATKGLLTLATGIICRRCLKQSF